ESTFRDTDDGDSSSNFIDFASYIDQTPITVNPRLPLETVMDLFKKMGPRVILIEHMGKLVGLITVKDELKYIARKEAEENGDSRAYDDSSPSGSSDEDEPRTSESRKRSTDSYFEVNKRRTSD
ncbi:4034_t:CDS:2, partial [Acaulospora colombiana]